MRGILRKIFLAVAAIILFYVMGGWKIPVLWRIESLELPKGWKTVYQTKIWISDVYWFHIKGEKVIKCDIGYEAAKEYIEEHNSAEELKED